jgi:D-beta-D-heptose 7-phosphate kinase/D-beta-D-heptose 1-phosphate adenosyltransferase
MMNSIKEKIKSKTEILKLVTKLKKKKKIIGFTNGCFDILHRGHIYFLEKTKRKVDILIVGLNSDSSIKKIKGNTRPINNEKDRAYLLASLRSVDYIVLFDEQTPYNLIRGIKPHYIFKGKDWEKDKVVGKDIVENYGGKVILIPYLGRYSTSKIISKIWKIKS